MTYTTTTSFYKEIEQYLDSQAHNILYTGCTHYNFGNRVQTTYSVDVMERGTSKLRSFDLCLDGVRDMRMFGGGSWWSFRQALEANEDVKFYKKLKTLQQVCAAY